MKGLKRLQAGGVLLREVRGIRKALEQLVALETAKAQWLQVVEPPPAKVQAPDTSEGQPVWITTVDDQLSADLADIELRLTGAKGVPPTEEEIIAAYHAQHSEPEDPRRLSVLEAQMEGRPHRG